MIKFLDLHKINARFESQFQTEFQAFLNTGHYVLGQGVADFERRYAEFCGVSHCIGVSSGFDALVLLFKAYKQMGRLDEGAEVLVPANTFIASIFAILEAGLKPVLVEPNPDTFNGEASEMQKYITPNTQAILAVHLYGQLAEMQALKQLAENHNLLLLEDAAQAHGAEDKAGLRAGNMSDAAAFSFYPAKNLGALGDAGAITTNDAKLAKVLRQLRNYGALTKYENERIGPNNRLDDIQARFLTIKLTELTADNEKRRAVARQYLNGIDQPKVKLPFYDESKSHIFHLFVILVENRNDFMAYMESHGIETAIHYPKPPHKQKALKALSHLVLPITEQIHSSCVSLPISPVMTRDEINHIIKAVNTY